MVVESAAEAVGGVEGSAVGVIGEFEAERAT